MLTPFVRSRGPDPRGRGRPEEALGDNNIILHKHTYVIRSYNSIVYNRNIVNNTIYLTTQYSTLCVINQMIGSMIDIYMYIYIYIYIHTCIISLSIYIYMYI